MPRAFLIKKKHSAAIGTNFRATSPKLFSPTSSGIASPNSSIGSTGSVSPRNDENDDGNNIQITPPKYMFAKDNNQGLDLSMKSLLKETNSLAEKTQKNEFPVSYGKPLYHELSFVSSYPYPAKFAKIADFLRNSEVSKSSAVISPIVNSSARHSPKNYESNFSAVPVSSPVIAQSQFPSTENVCKTLSSDSYHRLPPYSINWSEHFSVNKMSIVSPTPSSQGSDDSGRGSEHSEDSSMEKSTENGSVKSSNLKKCDRYQCTDCNKNYSTQSGLAKHQEFHCATQIKKSFSCKHCEKVYVSLGALKMHIRTHTLPCKCKLCGKAFSRPWLLQGHIRTHTGEKPFACQFCNRAFADRSNLRAHLQTHSVVKKYSCKTCSRTFSRMSLLLKHEDNGCGGSRSLTEMDNSSNLDM